MGVGKSCLLSKYVKGSFPTSPLPTIAVEFATKIIQLKEGGYVKSQIWDTAGQEKYKSITSYHYRKAVGALLVYDVTKRATFMNTQRWLKELREFAEPDCIVMLIGNKIDLVERNNKRREVPYEESKCYAEENGLMFSETSALSNLKVTESFEDLLQGKCIKALIYVYKLVWYCTSSLFALITLFIDIQ
jgi:small GTP-binding protein